MRQKENVPATEEPKENAEYLSEEEIPEEVKKNLPKGASVRRIRRKVTPESEMLKSIRQEAKERKELAQLKRARQGIAVTPGVLQEGKADYSAYKPVTVQQKAENFWYHKKWVVLVALFVAFLVVIGVVSKVSSRYDSQIVMLTEYPIDDPSFDFETPFSAYTGDYDGNGKQVLRMPVWYICRSYTPANAYENLLNNFRLWLSVSDYEPMVFIIDEANYKYLRDEVGMEFRDLSDLDESGRITGDRAKLSDLEIAADFPDFAEMFEGLYLCIYDLDQMATNSDGEPEDRFLENEKYMERYQRGLQTVQNLINGVKPEIEE